jgi:hypothetical protein
MRTGRFFRYVWRINAVAILLILAAAIVAMGLSFVSDIARQAGRHRTPAAQPIAQEDSETPLKLGPPRTVAGTKTLRLELTKTRPASKGYGSSSDSSETRNILFVDPATGASTWLLKSHKSIVAYTEDIHADDDSKQNRLLASIALVKPEVDNDDSATGELLVFDASGGQIASVGGKVRSVHAAVAVNRAEFIVVFERGGKYHIARFDSATRRKTGETEIKVPAIR